jgi:ABC-type antimicrobial peptide transport system permease subunit
MNTMYAAVSRRGREVGVLRALGFGRISVLVSFLIESIVLGAAGGAVGLALCLVVTEMSGLNSPSMTVGTLVFRYQLSAADVALSLSIALLVGALGGILPAIRATRIGVIDCIREG